MTRIQLSNPYPNGWSHAEANAWTSALPRRGGAPNPARGDASQQASYRPTTGGVRADLIDLGSVPTTSGTGVTHADNSAATNVVAYAASHAATNHAAGSHAATNNAATNVLTGAIDNAATRVAERGGNADAVAACRVKQQFLARFSNVARDPKAFEQLLGRAFGSYDKAAAEKIRQQTLRGDTSWLPEVKFVDASTLRGANGAFSAKENAIYLSRDLRANPSLLAKTFSEEAGHHIDTRIRTSDAPGDEGELFRRLLHGESMTKSEEAAIRREDDHGTIVVDGKQVEVEFFFKKIKKAFKKVTHSVSKVAKSVVQGATKAVTSVARTGTRAVASAFKTASRVASSVARGALSAGKSIASGVAKLAHSAFRRATSVVTSAVRGTGKLMASTFRGAVRFLGTGFQAAFRLLTNGLGSGVTVLRSLLGSSFGLLSGAGRGILGIGGSIWARLISAQESLLGILGR